MCKFLGGWVWKRGTFLKVPPQTVDKRYLICKIAQRGTKDNLRGVAVPDTNVARAPSTAIAVPLPPGGRQPYSKPFGTVFYKSEIFNTY